MARLSLDEVKHLRNFYRNVYRRSVTITMFLVVLAIILTLGIFAAHLSLPQSRYYATSGEAPPIELPPLSGPNQRSIPLLKNDLPDEIGQGKSIPQ